jgi:hypothetical protein
MDIGHILVGIADAMETASVTDAAKRVQSPPIPAKFSLTERVLVHMMRENTGASILDSGGAYGRAWQRNLTRDFSQVEDATLSGHVYVSTYGKDAGKNVLSLDVTIDLFTYLASRLDYDRALTRAFRKFSAERDSRSWLEDMEEFPKYIADKRGVDADNVYSGNSYNEDNFLSGTVQYTGFQLDGEDYVLLQIHGGCDVRGGYTAPAVFRVDDNCGTFGDWYNADIAPDWHEIHRIRESLKEDMARQTFLFPEVEAQMRAEVEAYGEQVYWSVGGYEDHGEGASHNLDDYPCEEIEDRSQWKRGTVCVLTDGTVLCPETGAKLVAGFVH